MDKTPIFYKRTPTFEMAVVETTNGEYDVRFHGLGLDPDRDHRFSLRNEDGASLSDVKIEALERVQRRIENQLRSLQETLNVLKTELRFERGDY